MPDARAEQDAELTVDEESKQAVARESAVMEDLNTEGDDVSREAREPKPDERVEPIHLTFYGSARLRVTAGNEDLTISDNRSRVGMVAGKFINPGLEIFTRVEFGMDLGRSLDNLLIPKDSPPAGTEGLFPRVGLLGFGTRFGAITAGKQWSAYYDVSGYTDRFAVFGAVATGTYNASTDGGRTGTGRADEALKYRVVEDRFALSLQAQGKNEIPQAFGQRYDNAVGGSLEYSGDRGLSAGIAYNHAFIDDVDDVLRAIGLDGDAQAGVVGVKYEEGPWYVGGTLARTKNHDTTDTNQYVDSTGWEIYSRYRISKRTRVVAGYNWLDPDKGDADAGRFDIRSAIAGFQWTYSKLDYGDIVYFEVLLDGGHNVDGTRRDNIYTVGFRYSVEL